MSDLPKSEEYYSNIDTRPPNAVDWMDIPTEIRKGIYCYASNPKSVEALGLPNARPWNPIEDDWKLPENWQDIVHEAFKERLAQVDLHDNFTAFRRTLGAFFKMVADRVPPVAPDEVVATMALLQGGEAMAVGETLALDHG